MLYQNYWLTEQIFLVWKVFKQSEVDCMLVCRLTTWWVFRGEGKAIDSSVQEGKEGEGLKAFFYPKGPQGNLWSTIGFLQKVAEWALYLSCWSFLFIDQMTTSTSRSSNFALFTRLFDEDMKQELSNMMDMVREMYEDGRKSNMLRK